MMMNEKHELLGSMIPAGVHISVQISRVKRWSRNGAFSEKDGILTVSFVKDSTLDELVSWIVQNITSMDGRKYASAISMVEDGNRVGLGFVMPKDKGGAVWHPPLEGVSHASLAA
jgi:hypothetical protein